MVGDFPVLLAIALITILDEFNEYRSRPGIQSGIERLGDYNVKK